MELKTNHSLDMVMTKDDLIDIMVDNQLVKLETKLQVLEDEKKFLSDKISKNKEEIKQKFDKVLLNRSLPKGQKKENVKTIFYREYSSCDVHFYFDGFYINVANQNCIDNSAFKKQKVEENNKLQDKISILSSDIVNLEQEIITITKSPKRLKAQMLKSFLGSSSQGKQVLELINKNISADKLLSAPKKS